MNVSFYSLAAANVEIHTLASDEYTNRPKIHKPAYLSFAATTARTANIVAPKE